MSGPHPDLGDVPLILAIETSTDALSVALGSGRAGAPVWAYHGAGGAQASVDLLPQVQRLLAEAGVALRDLAAIAFGRGPGAFTGLRTACAVAQGLAYGSRSARHPQGLPVLALDTLQAVADTALAAEARDGHAAPRRCVTLLDARMNELYVAAYTPSPDGPVECAGPRLCAPDAVGAWMVQQGWIAPGEAMGREDLLVAGNAFGVYPQALGTVPGRRREARPTAEALLRLAPHALAQGRAVPARDALPLYVRDKVALTTAEREAHRVVP